MAKVEIDVLRAVLKRNLPDVRAQAQILSEVDSEMKELAAEEEKQPPVKKQWIIVISDPEGQLEGIELTGWIAQIPEEDSVVASLDKFYQSAYAYNVTKKGRRFPVESIAEVCEAVPAKITKEQNLWIKTKEPVAIVRTDNTIPTGLEPTP